MHFLFFNQDITFLMFMTVRPNSGQAMMTLQHHRYRYKKLIDSKLLSFDISLKLFTVTY